VKLYVTIADDGIGGADLSGSRFSQGDDCVSH
jgi:hypothetical protein